METFTMVVNLYLKDDSFEDKSFMWVKIYMHNYYLYGLLQLVVLVTLSYVLDLLTYMVEYLETLCDEVAKWSLPACPEMLVEPCSLR